MRTFCAVVCMILGLAFLIPADAATDSTLQLQQDLAASHGQVKLLKAEIEVIKSYQESLLLTVYWALGTLATIAAVLVGFGWFANFRIYERDKAALVQELRSVIDAELQKSKQAVESHIAESAKAIPDLVTRELQTSLTSFRKDLEETLNGLTKKVDAHARALGRGLQELDFELRELEHKSWLKQQVMTNALRTARKMLQIALSLGNGFLAARVLDLIRSDLTAMLAPDRKGMMPDAEDVSTLITALDQVGPEHTIMVGAIRDLLASAKAR